MREGEIGKLELGKRDGRGEFLTREGGITFVSIETKVTIKNVTAAVFVTFAISLEQGFVKPYFSRQAEEETFFPGKG